MAEVGRAAADLIGNREVELDSALVGDRREVEHRVRRAPERHVDRERVLKGLAGHDVAGLDVLFHELHDPEARLLREPQARGVHRRDRAVAGEREAEDLGEAVHRVRGEHPRTGPAGRTGVVLEIKELRGRDPARAQAAHALRDVGVGDLAALEAPGEHRAAAHDDRGDVEACGGHQQTGDVLVAGRNEHQAVEGVRDRHRLGRVRDQFARDERVLHADVPHGEAVADRDRGKHYRNASSEGYALLHRVHDLVEVRVARNDVVLRAHDADERTADFVVAQTERLQEGPLRRGVDTVLERCASHGVSSPSSMKRCWGNDHSRPPG